MKTELVLHTKAGELFKNGSKIDDGVSNYRVWNDALLYDKDGKDLYVYHSGNTQKVEGTFFLSHFWGNEEKFVVLKEELGEDVYYEFDSIFRMRKMPISNSFIKQFYRNVYISQKGHALECYTTEGNLLWNIGLNDLLGGKTGVIMSNLVFFRDKLFFYLNDYPLGVSKTFCVELMTGRILNSTEQIKGWLTLYKEKLFATRKKGISVMDVNTFSVSFLPMEDQLIFLPDHLGMSYNKFFVADDFFFFSGERTSDIGVISLTEKKVLWRKELEAIGDKPVIRQIMTIGNLLFVIDQHDTLHSFEYSED